jgi:hypothetical protein
MTHPDLSQELPVGPSSLQWVLSPLDYRTHVLADGDQAVGVVKARCGAVLPVAFPVRDAPSDRPCPPCEVILRVAVDSPGGFGRTKAR